MRRVLDLAKRTLPQGLTDLVLADLREAPRRRRPVSGRGHFISSEVELEQSNLRSSLPNFSRYPSKFPTLLPQRRRE